METDAFLVEQTLAGNERAFACLVEKYRSNIFALCLAKVKSPQDAEELTQDTFARAYFKLSQLKNGKKFFQWLKQIAQNECKMYLRQPKQPVVTLADCSKLASKVQVEEQILRQELIEAVMDAIKSLPQKDREVIKACVSGFSHDEISQMTGLSYRASINRLHRIRKKIAEQVKELLNGIGVIFKILPLKKCLSGGIIAMKIGTSTKVTVGVIGVLAAGVIGFNILTHQPDVKSPEIVTKQRAAKSRIQPSAPKESYRPEKFVRQRTTDSERSVQKEKDAEQQVVDEFLAWLDSLKEEEIGDEADENENNQRNEIFWGMTREELEAKTPILRQEIEELCDRAIYLHGLLTARKSLDDPFPLEVQLHGPELREEYGRMREILPRKILTYSNYRKALDGEIPPEVKPSGWMYETLKETLFITIRHIEPGTPEYEEALEKARRLREMNSGP